MQLLTNLFWLSETKFLPIPYNLQFPIIKIDPAVAKYTLPPLPLEWTSYQWYTWASSPWPSACSLGCSPYKRKSPPEPWVPKMSRRWWPRWSMLMPIFFYVYTRRKQGSCCSLMQNVAYRTMEAVIQMIPLITLDKFDVRMMIISWEIW